MARKNQGGRKWEKNRRKSVRRKGSLCLVGLMCAWNMMMRKEREETEHSPSSDYYSVSTLIKIKHLNVLCSVSSQLKGKGA